MFEIVLDLSFLREDSWFPVPCSQDKRPFTAAAKSTPFVLDQKAGMETTNDASPWGLH